MNPSTDQSDVIMPAAPTPADAPLPRNLSESLERLQVAEEELREQNVSLLEAQDALELERYQYRALFETAPTPYLVTDLHGIIRMANRAAATLLGTAADELPGRPIANFVAPQDRSALRGRVSAMACAADAVPPARLDLEIRPRHGNPVRGTVTLSRALNHRSGDAALLWMASDPPVAPSAPTSAPTSAPRAEMVDELRRVNAELKVANRETLTLLHREQKLRRALERAEGAKAHFFAVLSHELRTPLQAIFGYTELLARELEPTMTPTQLDYLRRIEKSERHLLGLVNNVLDFERMTRGSTVHVDMGPVPVGEVLDVVGAVAASQAADKGITLEITPPADTVTVLGDRGMVQQVLVNLLSNAIKFTPSGGRVQLDARHRPGDIVAIMVCDTGRGIPASQLDRIFDPFTQIANDDARRGSGLGLAISRNIARTLGGELQAESEVGHGSKFTLTLLDAHPEMAAATLR